MRLSILLATGAFAMLLGSSAFACEGEACTMVLIGYKTDNPNCMSVRNMGKRTIVVTVGAWQATLRRRQDDVPKDANGACFKEFDISKVSTAKYADQ
ncbi:hypothetical protein HNQ60_005198 [Povalibacter uvarum]|uniref:Uncharacterized protein n=1 Tax=Povalibacter uvarum TaxID=732238 RepID=A0A841HTP7_9GAMM|nr:hypothetical protein [Povalibacter uvarum]MBB6096276.1 hypothetical protein [Povalibacter uvarum]